MRKQAYAPLLAGVLLALAGTANAATKQTTFQVTASVVNNCVVSATDLAFGPFDASADVPGSSTVNVRCTNGTGYTVTLGAGGSGDQAARAMARVGGGTLAYNLYTDNTHGTVFGDGNGGTGTSTGVGAGLSVANNQAHTVFGLLPLAGNEDAPVGNYADTVQVTVTY